MPKTLLQKIIIAIAGLAIITAAVLFFMGHHQSKVDISTKGQPSLGKTKAPVQVIAFEDMKCVNCKMFSQYLYPHLKEKYIDKGQARYTTILVAFIPGSIPAANAAYCLNAQNPKFFYPFIEYVYNHQPPENENWATLPQLLSMAKESVSTANLDALSECIVEGRYNEKLQKNLELAQKAMSQDVATPAVYVNGLLIQPLTEENLNEAIKKAE